MDALRKMQLMDKPPPSWKLIDNRGSVTVLLHWDQKDRAILNGLPSLPAATLNGCTCTPLPLSNGSAQSDTAYLELLQADKRPCHAHNYGRQLQVAASRGRLSPRPPSFNDDESRAGQRTEEEDLYEQLINGTPIVQLMSPATETARCDFHCAALHSVAGAAAAKSDLNRAGPHEHVANVTLRPCSPGGGLIKKSRDVGAPVSTGPKGHVRFVDDQQHPYLSSALPAESASRPVNIQAPIVQIAVTSVDQCEAAALPEHPRHTRPPTTGLDSTILDRVDEESRDDYESSVSEPIEPAKNSKSSAPITTTTTALQGVADDDREDATDENETPIERHLLLVDQIDSIQLPDIAHLTVKEIGQILDKLSSKIIEVDKLEREKDGLTHNWLIRAMVRGEMAGEIGVVHNGKYYGIVQHPAYC